MFTVVLMLIACLLAIAGGTLLWRGWWGRLLDDRPYCGHCGYERSPGFTRCPECGRIVVLRSEQIAFALNHPVRWRLQAVTRWGRRARSWRRLAAGALTTSIGISLMGGAILIHATGLQWYQYAPSGVLFANATSHPIGTPEHTRAVSELRRRAVAGRLPASEVQRLERMLLASQWIPNAPTIPQGRQTAFINGRRNPVPAAKDLSPAPSARAINDRPVGSMMRGPATSQSRRIELNDFQPVTSVAVPDDQVAALPTSGVRLPVSLQWKEIDQQHIRTESRTASPVGRALPETEQASLTTFDAPASMMSASRSVQQPTSPSITPFARMHLDLEWTYSTADQFELPDPLEPLTEKLPVEQYRRTSPPRDPFRNWKASAGSVSSALRRPAASWTSGSIATANQPVRFDNRPLARPVRLNRSAR